MSGIAPRARPVSGSGAMLRNPFRRRSPHGHAPAWPSSPRSALLCGWALVVLLPIYWLVVTSFKTPYQVDKGPFYIPFVDFQPTLDAWRYILVELGNDTLRPYVNTIIVGPLERAHRARPRVVRGLRAGALHVRPRFGIIGLFIGCLAFAA